MLCVVCNKSLTGRQTKFCSRQCKNIFSNNNAQSYEAQKVRAVNRKLELIMKKGGKCEICGYDVNLAALCFHHNDPTTKELKMDSRHLSNNKFSQLVVEANKCLLLCHNCHMELHYPHFDMKKLCGT
jgi:predicted nucleic acid-binding Zn ribbon protein